MLGALLAFSVVATAEFCADERCACAFTPRGPALPAGTIIATLAASFIEAAVTGLPLVTLFFSCVLLLCTAPP
eukprot:5239832-Pyramimonas_sp.AAC.3